MALISTSQKMSDFGAKAEQFLTTNFPGQLDKAVRKIHIGSNLDTAAGLDAGYRITGATRNAAPDYMETPDKVIGDNLIANAEAKARTVGFETKITDSAKNWIAEAIQRRVEKGETFDAAKKSVYDSIDLIGYKDKDGKMVAQPIIKGVNDSDLVNMQVPFWNITYLNKIYKQPMLKGYAKHLVSEIGVPNVWADAVSIWTESFEGMARVANVAKTLGQHNVNEATKVRTHQIISQFVNIVADFEMSTSDPIYGGLNGNPLTNAAIGDNEMYTRFMLEQMHNALIYFGDNAAGFDGLAQMTAEIQWSGAPFEHIYNDSSNPTQGADMIETLNHMIGDWLEELNFMPTKVRICCSPTMYKCLKFALTSKVYNQVSPLKIISEGAFEGTDGKFLTTTPIKSIDGINRTYEFCSDPMLMATDSTNGIINPWNSYDTDLMYITFPEFQSDLSGTGLTDVVMAPTAISNMVLPYFYGASRDGLGRTMLKRVGSIICPVEGAVKVIRGIGRNLSYS